MIVIGSRSYPPIDAPPIRTASAIPPQTIGDKRSSARLPSAVSRQPVAEPSGVGTSQATQAVTATRLIIAPQSGPNEKGSRFAIHRAMATVAATAATKAKLFCGFLSPFILTDWSLLLDQSG